MCISLHGVPLVLVINNFFFLLFFYFLFSLSFSLGVKYKYKWWLILGQFKLNLNFFISSDISVAIFGRYSLIDIFKMLNFVNTFVFFCFVFLKIYNFTSCGTRILNINIYVFSVDSIDMWSQCEISNYYKFVIWRVFRVQ